MPQRQDNQNILIVEGADDRHSVIGLMKFHTNWPDERREWPVFVEVGGSVDEILATGYLTAEIKARSTKQIGVMLDADASASGRYQRIQQLCGALFPNLPEQMPAGGLVVEYDEKRLGVWLMPDNLSEGDLEIFLRCMVPSEGESLWSHACESVKSAISMGAKCRESHLSKANMYTWLAWQDPPGQSPGIALTKRILDPRSKLAEPFVKWFKELYRL